MDDETRDAREMTKDELAARFDAGKPAKVRKTEDFVQRMKRVVDESTAEEEIEGEVWVFQRVYLGVDGSGTNSKDTADSIAAPSDKVIV